MAKPRQVRFVAGADSALVPIGTLLTRQAQRGPGHPILTFGGRTWSRAELEAGANRRARTLQDLGVGEGDFVTIGLPNGPEFHEVAFAVWKLGAVPAPVSYRLPDAELGAIVDLVQPKLVVGFEPGRVKGFAAISAGQTPDARIADTPLPERVAPHWKATTSGGSTGRPKVIVDHKPGLFSATATALGMELDDIVLNPAPLYHNAPFGIAHMAMWWGGHVVEMAKFDPLEALHLIERHRVKWAYLVPTMMSRIWDLPAAARASVDLSSLEEVLHMAAACPTWLKQNWIDWLGAEAIWELYAGTEGLGGTIISGEEWLAHKGSVGRIDPAFVRIVGEDGTSPGVGEVGEIFFRAPGGRGSTYHYIGAEPKVLGDWESYGDLGSLDADAYLYLADRRTDLIVSGGANIYPAEIEAALDSHPGVASSVVVGLPDDDLGHHVHAIIQPAGADFAVADTTAFVASQLARYKLPHTFDLVAEPLRDDTGKVRRSALRDARIARAQAGEVFERFRS